MCGGVTPDRQEDLGSFIRLWRKACGCFEHLYPDALQGLDHLLQKPVFLFQDRDFGFEEAWVSARSSRNRSINRSG